MNLPDYYSEITFFMAVISIGGVLGGLIQSFRSPKSYLLPLPRISSSLLHETKHWDTGFLGFIFAGIVGAFILIGLLRLGTTFDFTNLIDGQKTPTEQIKIPASLFLMAQNSDGDSVQTLFELVVNHNNRINESNEQDYVNTFWAWFELFSMAIIGGFGGVGIVTKAYESYASKDQVEELNQKVDQEIQHTIDTRIELEIGKAREMVEDGNSQEALRVCNQILTQLSPHNARAFGIKAKALRNLNQMIEAISVLEETLSVADMLIDMRGKIQFNLACYLTQFHLSEGIIPTRDHDVLGKIRTLLEESVRNDRTLKHYIKDDSDLTILQSEEWLESLIETY